MTTLHLIGLPHTQLDAARYSACAFTAKAVRTIDLWRDRNLEVVSYWGASGDVPLLTEAEQSSYFGAYDPAALPVLEWDARLPYWELFHARAADELSARLKDGDIIGFVGGAISRELAQRFAGRYTLIEPGIGYSGVMPELAWGCYESYAWLHDRYGALGVTDGRPYDTVIPNVVLPGDWTTGPSQGYALYVGRVIARKGVHVAAQIAEAAGLPLKVAGAGVAEVRPGRITATDGTVIEGDHVEYVGAVTGTARQDLFAGAEVLLMPTLYLEPWGGVHVEAMMSGVAPVCSDWGAFTETVPRQLRFRSLAQALDAVDYARAHRGLRWRERATELAGPELCGELYASWIDRLRALRDGRNGWYAPR